MGFPIQEIEDSKYEGLVDVFRIEIPPLQKMMFFKWGVTEHDPTVWISISNRLKSILLNGVTFDKDETYNNQKLKQFVDAHYPNLTPEEKLDSLLEGLSKMSRYEGEPLSLKPPSDLEANRLYFTNPLEWSFYLDTAAKLGLLEKSILDGQMAWHLTISGLSRLIKIRENKESRYCFVAMAFDKEMNSLYTETIEVALVATGFIPIRVDKVHIPSDKTINDEIIAGIKRARFTIADFTNHKDGVYFEAGYALGRGKKVIYSCREDHMEDAHFDIRNYQHIVWKDAADFQKKLVDKIEAFIKD